jgi:hypothetical protein
MNTRGTADNPEEVTLIEKQIQEIGKTEGNLAH